MAHASPHVELGRQREAGVLAKERVCDVELREEQRERVREVEKREMSLAWKATECHRRK